MVSMQCRRCYSAAKRTSRPGIRFANLESNSRPRERQRWRHACWKPTGGRGWYWWDAHQGRAGRPIGHEHKIEPPKLTLRPCRVDGQPFIVQWPTATSLQPDCWSSVVLTSRPKPTCVAKQASLRSRGAAAAQELRVVSPADRLWCAAIKFLLALHAAQHGARLVFETVPCRLAEPRSVWQLLAATPAWSPCFSASEPMRASLIPSVQCGCLPTKSWALGPQSADRSVRPPRQLLTGAQRVDSRLAGRCRCVPNGSMQSGWKGMDPPIGAVGDRLSAQKGAGNWERRRVLSIWGSCVGLSSASPVRGGASS